MVQSQPWEQAGDACRLYGGYLAKLGNLQEQNCLMMHANAASINGWFWINGGWNCVKEQRTLIHFSGA